MDRMGSRLVWRWGPLASRFRPDQNEVTFVAVLQDDFIAPVSAAATDRAGEPVDVTITVGDEVGESGDPVLSLQDIDGVTYVVPGDLGTGTVHANAAGLDEAVLSVDVVASNAVSINFTLGEPIPNPNL